MSQSIEEQLKTMNEALAAHEALAARKKAVDDKALALREHKVDYDYSNLEQTKRELEGINQISYGELNDGAIKKLIEDNDAYMLAAKQSLQFICSSFKGVVPYFRKNLIVVAGDTGDGKSTAVANIVSDTISQRSPRTGKPCRTLILTNEEAPEDFYNRITCHINGWQYTNHDNFTDEQRKTFSEWIPKLAKGGRLTVIGDIFEGISGTTTTVEGIEGVFRRLMEKNEHYDVVLIDYYQNVQRSKNDPKLVAWQCQALFASLLDQLKIHYPGVIVVMAQIKKLANEEDTTPFNVRLKGSKLLCDKATFIVELIPERDKLRSRWVIWKSRFTDFVGQALLTGYDRGKFVNYDDPFKAKVAQLIASRMEKKLEEELPEGVMKKGKKNGQKDAG